MVPNGWTVKTLNDVSRITRLAGAEYSDVWETNSNGEIIALRGFNIGNNEVNLRDVERITQDLRDPHIFSPELCRTYRFEASYG